MQSSQAPPAWVTYLFFFNHIVHLEKLADEQEALGNREQAASWRTFEQRAAGLSNEEAGVLREIAASCGQAVSDIEGRVRAAAGERGQSGSSSTEPDPSSDLKRMLAERTQVTERYAAELRDRFGKESFERLDGYIRATFEPGVQHELLQPPLRPLSAVPEVGITDVGSDYVWVRSHSTYNPSPTPSISAECDTLISGDYAPYYSVYTQCQLLDTTTICPWSSDAEGASYAPCRSGPITAYGSLKPGHTYWTQGDHFLFFESQAYCYPYWYDAVRYVGNPTYTWLESATLYPQGPGGFFDPPQCVTSPFFEIARSVSSRYTIPNLTIQPPNPEDLAGQQVHFSVTPAVPVAWSGEHVDPATGVFTAPADAAGQDFTVTATSTEDSSVTASTVVRVPRVLFDIQGRHVMSGAAGATQTLGALVNPASINGTAVTVTWKIVSGSRGFLGPDPSNPSNSYSAVFAPPPDIGQTETKNTETEYVQACVANTSVCSDPYDIEVVAPVILKTVSPPSWPAGSSVNPVTFGGTGFGKTPIVTLPFGIVLSGCSVTNLSISCVATIPLAAAGNIPIQVQSMTDGIASSSTLSGKATAIGPTFGITMNPASVSLWAGQTQVFHAPVGCKTQDNHPCSVPQDIICGFATVPNSAPKGTIVGGVDSSGVPTCVYKAPASIGISSQDRPQACAKVSASVCAAATVTLMPIVVTVNPATFTLKGCDTKVFTSVVSSNPDSPAVTWSVAPTTAGAPTGTIQAQGPDNTQGLYRAPCPLQAPASPVTVNACSAADAAQCGRATVALLSLASISPTSGPMAGGTQVALNGSGFKSPLSVSFGNTAATSITVQSATQATIVTPVHACGVVDVSVTSDNQTVTLPGAFSYTSPQPPTGLSPNGTVFPSTTTSVTLSWAAVSGATQYAVRVQDLTDGTIRDPRNNCGTNTIYLCVGPVLTTTYSVPVRAGHSYSWWVHAGSSCGQYSVQTNGSFSVAAALPAPTVTAISPANGPMAGGTLVTITGTGFRAGAAMSIGGAAATGVTVVSATSITAATGAHACGTVNVVVTNTDGQSGTLASGFFYTSPQPPAGLSPNGTTLPSTTTSVTLSWAAVSGATQYAVRVQDLTDGTLRDPRNNCGTNTIYLCVGPVLATTYSLPVQAGHSYNWWVHAGSACGQYSVQTNGSFSVAAALPAPTVTAISPANGPMAGGTLVTITGTGFRAGAAVSIGGAAATGVTVVSATSITATTGASACGTFNVIVTNTDGKSGILASGFFYTSPQPPTGLSPNGTTLPGTTTSVTLSWAAVSGATQYAVRVQDLTDGTIRDPRNNCGTNTIYLCVGPVLATTYSVPVQSGHSYAWWVHAGSACGQYSVQTNGSFSVRLPAPTVTAISPTSGPDTGGTSVTITGTGFRSGAGVTFGGVAAAGVSVPSGSQITATAPAHAAGAVNIVVTNSDGQSGTLFNGFTYNLSIPPSPTGLSPNGATLPGTTTSVTMSWSPTPGATKYAVRLQDNTDGTYRDPRNNCPVNTIELCVNDIVSTSYSAPVAAGHSYTWWVHAGNAAGYSSQTYASFSVAVDPLHAPTGLAKEASPSRNLLWNPPNNLTGADAVTYDLWIYGGSTCAAGCLYHPAAPSWYTMGAEIVPGTYSWTLKANSVSRPSSGAVSGPSFTMP